MNGQGKTDLEYKKCKTTDEALSSCANEIFSKYGVSLEQ